VISLIPNDLDENDILHIHGGIRRYLDFYEFLDFSNIQYDKIPKNGNINVYDSNTYNFKNFKARSTDYLFLSSIEKILYRNKTPFRNFIIHNLFIANKIKCYFLPMLGFSDKYLFKKNTIFSKYEYGIHFTIFDGNYNSILNFIDMIGHDKVILLCKDKDFIPKDYLDVELTSDTSTFINSIECLVDFYDIYSARHVMSRLYIECFLAEIPFKTLAPYGEFPLLHSLLQFSSIKYTFLETFDKIFDIYELDYDNKYFRTDTYSKYITECFNNGFIDCSNIKYIEELSNVYY
jgi:hypothetical protein